MAPAEVLRNVPPAVGRSSLATNVAPWKVSPSPRFAGIGCGAADAGGAAEVDEGYAESAMPLVL